MGVVEVQVNGEDRVLETGTTVAHVVDLEVCTRRGVAVALNGTVVARSTWEDTTLSSGDAIEILGVAAGG